MIVLLKKLAAAITTPATDKVALYVESTDGIPRLKDDAGDTTRILVESMLAGLTDAADDAAASGAGVPVGGMYRTGSILKVRIA